MEDFGAGIVVVVIVAIVVIDMGGKPSQFLSFDFDWEFDNRAYASCQGVPRSRVCAQKNP